MRSEAAPVPQRNWFSSIVSCSAGFEYASKYGDGSVRYKEPEPGHPEADIRTGIDIPGGRTVTVTIRSRHSRHTGWRSEVSRRHQPIVRRPVRRRRPRYSCRQYGAGSRMTTGPIDRWRGRPSAAAEETHRQAAAMQKAARFFQIRNEKVPITHSVPLRMLKSWPANDYLPP